MDEAQCHAISVRRYLTYAAVFILATLGILFWKVVNIEHDAVVVPKIVQKIEIDEKVQALRDQHYLEQHDVTHRQINKVIDTQHHIMAQQDANIKEIRQIKSKLK